MSPCQSTHSDAVPRSPPAPSSISTSSSAAQPISSGLQPQQLACKPRKLRPSISVFELVAPIQFNSRQTTWEFKEGCEPGVCLHIGPPTSHWPPNLCIKETIGYWESRCVDGRPCIIMGITQRQPRFQLWRMHGQGHASTGSCGHWMPRFPRGRPYRSCVLALITRSPPVVTPTRGLILHNHRQQHPHFSC